MSLHFELADAVRHHFADRLAAAPELRQDALTLQLTDGTAVEIRYAAADAYSLRWHRDGRWRSIDTAPCHPELGTWPNHFHAGDGSVHDDPVTTCGAAPWANLQRLLQALVESAPALSA